MPEVSEVPELSSHQELIAYIEAREQNFAVYDV